MKLRGLYAITPQASDLERKVRLALEGGIALLNTEVRAAIARKLLRSCAWRATMAYR